MEYGVVFEVNGAVWLKVEDATARGCARGLTTGEAVLVTRKAREIDELAAVAVAH